MTLKLGLIGHPVSHSLSPPMHQAAFSFFGLAGSYELIDIEPSELKNGIEKICKDGFSGFNVTIPYKEEVFGLLRQRSLEASLVGAANTVRIDSAGKLTAHNTDLGGFRQALSRALTPLGGQASFLQRKALVLGAGGVARACVAGLCLSGWREIVIAARRLAEAEKVYKSIYFELSRYLPTNKSEISFVPFDKVASLGGFGLVLNCTSVGLAENGDEATWFDPVIATMDREALFFDSVYMRDRSPTLLMSKVAQKGLSSVDGLAMLVEQAALAFEYWAGRRPSAELMYNALPSYNHIMQGYNSTGVSSAIAREGNL